MVTQIKKKRKKREELPRVSSEQTFQIGNTKVSKEEFLSQRAQEGFGGRTGTPPLLERLPPIPERRQVTGEERLEAFQKETGSDVLREGLQEKILNPPSLAPEPGDLVNRLQELGGQSTQDFLGSREFQPVGITATSAAAKLLLNPEKELRRAGEELAVGTVIGLGLPFLTQISAKATLLKAIGLPSWGANLLKTAVAGTAIFVLGRGIFDIQGGEMDIMRQGLKKVVEDGERLEAAARNGLPTSDTIEVLTDMVTEVDAAEERIKQLGITNIKYRVDKQFILDQQNARSARSAILRRVLALENIAATGQASLNPNELLFEAGRL